MTMAWRWNYLIFVLTLFTIYITTINQNAINFAYMNYRVTQVEGVANKLEKYITTTGEINNNLIFKAFHKSKLSGDKTTVKVHAVSNANEVAKILKDTPTIGNSHEFVDKKIGAGVIYYSNPNPGSGDEEFTYGDPINFIVFNKTKLPFSDQIVTVSTKRAVVVKGRTDSDTGLDYEYGYN